MEEQRGAEPIEVVTCLQGLKFPASKQDILHLARSHDAPSNVMAVLEEIPDQEYLRYVDIVPELEETEEG